VRCDRPFSFALAPTSWQGVYTWAGFTLLTGTNITLPMDLRTPLATSQFDQFGVFTRTNLYSPAVPQQFFRLRLNKDFRPGRARTQTGNAKLSRLITIARGSAWRRSRLMFRRAAARSKDF
jgi:hypothetical protein